LNFNYNVVDNWIYIKAAVVVDNEDECTFAYAPNHGGIDWGESTLGAWSGGYVMKLETATKKKKKQTHKQKRLGVRRFLET
jgi:hypothetical protein